MKVWKILYETWQFTRSLPSAYIRKKVKEMRKESRRRIWRVNPDSVTTDPEQEVSTESMFTDSLVDVFLLLENHAR